MRDITAMWRYTKMVVLVALTGAAYVAILLPFKIATIVPGFTEIRPASGIPIVCALLFGPAAAWGSAFGNLVGDIFGGTLTPGSIAGFVDKDGHPTPTSFAARPDRDLRSWTGCRQ